MFDGITAFGCVAKHFKIFKRNIQIVFLLCYSFYDAAMYFPFRMTSQNPPKVTCFKFSEIQNLLKVGWFLAGLGLGSFSFSFSLEGRGT